jgi:exodeoxyribonuclease VII small subunit
MSYEEAIKELEEIIAKLEGAELPLKTSLELFERAGELAKFAQEELTKTTGKLVKIKQDFDKITEEEV